MKTNTNNPLPFFCPKCQRQLYRNEAMPAGFGRCQEHREMINLDHALKISQVDYVFDEPERDPLDTPIVPYNATLVVRK